MNRTRAKGFTLVEQLAVLAVVAILASIAVPPLSGLLGRSAARVTQHALFAAAHLARTQAIMHGTHVVLCPSDGQRCLGPGNWVHGWIVAIDANQDGQPDGAILRHTTLEGRDVRLVGSGHRAAVRFQPDGSAAGTNITLLVCPRHVHPAPVRSVVISNGGRIREAMASTEQRNNCTM